MAQTQIIQPTKKTLKTDDDEKHNVCAYCRVSTDEFDQKNSLASQKMFFERYFDKHENWNNLGIFADATDIIGLKQNPTNGRRFSPIFSFIGHFRYKTRKCYF